MGINGVGNSDSSYDVDEGDGAEEASRPEESTDSENTGETDSSGSVERDSDSFEASTPKPTTDLSGGVSAGGELSQTPPGADGAENADLANAMTGAASGGVTGAAGVSNEEKSSGEIPGEDGAENAALANATAKPGDDGAENADLANAIAQPKPGDDGAENAELANAMAKPGMDGAENADVANATAAAAKPQETPPSEPNLLQKFQQSVGQAVDSTVKGAQNLYNGDGYNWGDRVHDVAEGAGLKVLETGKGLIDAAQFLDKANPLSALRDTVTQTISSPFNGDKRSPVQIAQQRFGDMADADKALAQGTLKAAQWSSNFSLPGMAANYGKTAADVTGDVQRLASQGQLRPDTLMNSVSSRLGQNPTVKASADLANSLVDVRSIKAAYDSGDPRALNRAVGAGLFQFTTLVAPQASAARAVKVGEEVTAVAGATVARDSSLSSAPQNFAGRSQAYIDSMNVAKNSEPWIGGPPSARQPFDSALCTNASARNVLHAMGRKDVSMWDLAKTNPPRPTGLTTSEVADMLQAYGVDSARAVENKTILDFGRQINETGKPQIMGARFPNGDGHAITINKVENGVVYYQDPLRGTRQAPITDFADRYKGVFVGGEP